MKLVISVFRHVITPFAVVFVVVAGILAALVSAGIEYFVLQQWLRPENQDLIFIPALIVLALEGTKLYLHFSEAAFKQNKIPDKDKESLQNFVAVMPLIKAALIGFSVLCTLIYTASSFYSMVPGETPESIQQAKADIDLKYEDDWRAAVDAIDKTYQDTVDTAYISVQTAQAYFDSITIVYTPLREYERTSKEKADALQVLKNAQAEYVDAQKSADAVRTSSMDAARQSLDKWRKEQMSLLDSSELAQIAGNNPYLSRFLLFFSKTFMGDVYTPASYYVWVVAISLILSILLECVISLSQRVITLPVGVLLAISEAIPINAETRKKLMSAFQYLTSALIAFSVFLVYGMIQEISYNPIQLGAALVCSLVSIVISSVIFKGFDLTTQNGIPPVVQKIIAEAKAVVVKGLLSFGGFIIIGLLFGETFASMSLSAIGISIGNIVGHSLHLLPSNRENVVPV